MPLRAVLIKSEEAQIYVHTMRELGNSFEAEVTPRVVEMEGKIRTDRIC
jgi:hypothetical protein